MKNISILLYFLGLIISIVSAAKYTDTMTTSQIMLSPTFILGMLMALGGLVWWRSQIKADHNDDSTEDSGGSPAQLILSIKEELEILIKEMPNYGREDWLKHLTKIQDNFIIRFNDKRGQLLSTMSAEQGSDLMIKFSYGERMLNRAYSCSADGHHDEGIVLAPIALKSFEDCLYILKK